MAQDKGASANARIVISTRPCEHCEGTGVQPSAEMIEAVQQAIERGFLDGDGVLEVVAAMYAQAIDARSRRDAP